MSSMSLYGGYAVSECSCGVKASSWKDSPHSHICLHGYHQMIFRHPLFVFTPKSTWGELN